jgi:recombination DNA repair RAD52 pathway protein
MTEQQRGITAEQYDTLMKPIRGTRVSSRSQGGKTLSYVEAWEIKAHLTRIFGFGNWDSEILDYRQVAERPYLSRDNKEMVEVSYSARVQLTVRDQWGNPLCRHSEAAVGSTSGPASMLGDHHDNALKTAASDALKRCAINLGSQFGLSLYDNGSLNEVVKMTIVKPEGVATVATQPTSEQEALLSQSLGATEVTT